MAPTVAHCVSLPAPRGGRCACGPAKPVPRPLLGQKRAPSVARCETQPGACGPALRQAQDRPRPVLRLGLVLRCSLRIVEGVAS